MSTALALSDSAPISSWKGTDGKLRPEAWTAIIAGCLVAGAALWFWGLILPFLLGLLIDTVHLAYLAGLLAGGLYLVFGKRPRLMFRVLVRKFTSLFVAVYPIEIIEDKLLQMKKRREKMNEQIGLVNGSIQKLQRKMQQNDADATKMMGQASYAKRHAGDTQDSEAQFRLQMDAKKAANAAVRRQNANIGFSKLLERIQKVYKFLTHYATNVDFFIDDTQDEIDQKKIEYQTTMEASGAMKQAMAVIRGNATEEDIYSQAFDYIENSVSTQLGIMDDLQRVSQNFMDGMDIENGAVDDAALQALNAFEQKALTAGNSDFQMVIGDKGAKPIPVLAATTLSVNSKSNDFSDLLN